MCFKTNSFMKLIFALIFLLLPFKAVRADIDPLIEKTSRYLIENWYADPSLKESNWYPPQIISLESGKKIYGGCGKDHSMNKVAGSFYCPAFHTVVLDPQQLEVFSKAIGPASIAYVVAHEFAHGVQHIRDIRLDAPMHELQADCIAGRLIDEGSKKLKITREDAIDMTLLAFSIGDEHGVSHGTPAQRAFAFTIGMGLVDYTCKEEDMKKLANNEIKNKLFEDWSNVRGSSSNKNLGKPIYKKNILDLID